MGKLNKKGLEMKMAYKAQMKEKRKELKTKKAKNRAKLIVRNLPFKVNESNLRSHFEQFGEIEAVNILQMSDGKKVGCGFVQFKLVQKAAKARHYLNGKPFLGRNIEVDFASSKNKYKKEKKIQEKTKEEAEVKEENKDDVDTSVVKIEDDEITDVKIEKQETQSVDDSSADLKESDEEDSSADESDDVEDETEIETKVEEEIKKPHVISNDVSEGKTVFIKNVPFSANNQDLRECMLQFGPMYYALICVDRLTEHSKGTAFVKFQEKEDAEKCLQAGTELKLLGNILDCHRAINKNDLQQKQKDSKDPKLTHKDSRNLYLVKEGVILAGTKAAEGVSASDMSKRLQLEQYKTQMLRNLNMYISRNRVIVHNLPPSWDDPKLRALFKKFAGPKAVITEAKIMRDLRDIDSSGVGKSKEYGFVTFKTHEDALTALRALNNNPNIFSATKRPIVAFSIENKNMVKAKEKRLLKSRQKNPKCKDYDPSAVQKQETDSYKCKIDDAEEREEFVGVTAKQGVNKMRSRFNIRTQAQLHHENLKKEKKKLKTAKKTLLQRKQEFTRQPQQKVNKKKKQENDSFAKLVNSYKQTLITAPAASKPKWYE